MRRLAVVALLVVATALLGGCGRMLGEERAQAGAEAGGGTEVVVFAAASLSEPFREIGDAFERENPGARVVFSFAGSSVLRAQLSQGASADVFASADLANAEGARAAGLTRKPVVFARNRLVIAVPLANPGRVEGLADLARPGLKLALAAPDVPAGAYAAEVFRRASGRPEYGADFAARVASNVVTREPNVKQSFARARLGEVDAAIVYATDASEATRSGQWAVRAIEIPSDLGVEAEYLIAAATRSQKQVAGAFVSFVLSPAGQEVLRRAGFAAP